MANTRDYTITVVSESLYQYDNQVQAPFILGGPFGAPNLRNQCVPYLAGSLTSIDRGMRVECHPYPQTLTNPLIKSRGGLYPPSLTYEQFIATSVITPGSQPYGPTFALTVPMVFQTPGGQLYDPSIFYDHEISVSLLSPGAQLYGPSISLSISLPLQGSGGRVYAPEIDLEGEMPLIAAGGRLYRPVIVYDDIVNMSLLSSGGQLYGPSIVFNIPMPLQSPGGQLYDPTFALTLPLPLQAIGGQLYGPIFALNVPMALQTPGSLLYIPTVTQASVVTSNHYTEIISASNPNNSSSMHVGSLYLDARTYTTMEAMMEAPAGAVGGSAAHIELKRFTNGTTLMSASTQNIPEVWFKMDEGTGTSITSSNGLYSASFEAGSTALSWESGSYSTGSYSIFFDQSGDYIAPPNAIWSTSSAGQTISFWARMTGDVAAGDDQATIFEYINSLGERIGKLAFPWDNGVVYWDCGNVRGGGWSFDRLTYDWGASSYNDSSQWHHWAFTKNIPTGQMRIYLDGNDVANSTGNTKTLDIATTSRIVCNQAGAQFWGGNLSDFAIWDVELPASDVTTLYNDGSGSIPSAISSSNLTVLYPFQEGAGSTCYDKSGNSRDGTITTITDNHWALADPTPQPRTFVKFPSDVDSYIEGPYNVNYTTGSAGGSFTAGCWIQWNDNPVNYEGLMAFDEPDGNWRVGWNFYYYNSKIYFVIRDDPYTTYGIAGVDADANLLTKQWNHVVGTWDGSTIKLYINGELGSITDSYSDNMHTTTTCVLQIGDGRADTPGLNATINNVKIWSEKALTQEEVTAIYNERVISKTSWENVTTSSVTVSTADWYDIYISASGNPATSSIRGIYYEY